MEGFGGTMPRDFVPFELEELHKFIGVLYVNAVSPKAPFTVWFKSVGETKVFGNGGFSKAFNKHVSGGRVISGEHQWNHCCQFMCLYDVMEMLQAKDPLWQVAPILIELPKNLEHLWVTGKWVAIDEQTVGFKDKHGLDLHKTYKKEGNSYQCDALCEDGYIFSFYFCHGDAPKLPELFAYPNLLATAQQAIFFKITKPLD